MRPLCSQKLGCHNGLGAPPPGSRFHPLDIVQYRPGQTEQHLPIIVQAELAGGAVKEAEAAREMVLQLRDLGGRPQAG
jgi:hypothetical protein